MTQEQHDDAQTIILLDDLKIIRRNLKRKFQLTVDVDKRNQVVKALARADELIRLLEGMYNLSADSPRSRLTTWNNTACG